MGYRSDVAIVLWKPDFDELVEKAKECNFPDFGWLQSMFDTAQTMTTPDEQYVMIYQDWVKWYSDYPEVRFIENFIANKRHSFIRLGEDHEDIVFDVRSTDDRGTDEEFDCFLYIRREIGFDSWVSDY